MELAAGLLGILGSILLGVPVYLGLGDRKALEDVEEVYRTEKASAQQAGSEEERQRRLLEAREIYESDRDGIIANVMGQYRSNYIWTLAGFAALFLALVLLIYGARGEGS